MLLSTIVHESRKMTMFYISSEQWYGLVGQKIILCIVPERYLWLVQTIMGEMTFYLIKGYSLVEANSQAR